MPRNEGLDTFSSGALPKEIASKDHANDRRSKLKVGHYDPMKKEVITHT